MTVTIKQIDEAIEFMVEDAKIDRTLDQMLQPYTDTILEALEHYKAMQKGGE